MTPPRYVQERIRFGPFVLERRTRRLLKRGVRVHLRPQSCEVLVALLERPGDLVTRQELRNRLWPEGIFVEFETSLNSIVNRLRDALGDHTARPRYIETIPRLGYRFLARVENRPAPRLLVLPFANLSGDPTQEYLSDGLSDELIARLATLMGERLSVIARTSAMRYKETRKSVRDIAKELELDYVLEGSIRRLDSRVRVKAQLIETSRESHVWAKTYDGELGDVLLFEEQLANAVAAEIRCTVAPGSEVRVSAAAYDAYIRGRFHGGRMSAPELSAAVECFERAVGLEPRFARAWAMLGMTWSSMAFWSHCPPGQAYLEAERTSRRALELDESQSEAHAALGAVLWFRDWDLGAVRFHLERAVDLNPSDAAAHLWLAIFLASMSLDFSRAAMEAERAQALDPLTAYIWGYSAWIHYWGRRYHQAVELAEYALAMDPKCVAAYYAMGLTKTATNRIGEAIEAFRAGTDVDPTSIMPAYLAMALGMAGDSAAAANLVAELEARSKTQYVFPICFAFAHLGMGDREAALDWLERAWNEHDSHLLWLRASHVWDPLRGTPRFRAIEERLPTPAVAPAPQG
jgi:TolB-like protein